METSTPRKADIFEDEVCGAGPCEHDCDCGLVYGHDGDHVVFGSQGPLCSFVTPSR